MLGVYIKLIDRLTELKPNFNCISYWNNHSAQPDLKRKAIWTNFSALELGFGALDVLTNPSSFLSKQASNAKHRRPHLIRAQNAQNKQKLANQARY